VKPNGGYGADGTEGLVEADKWRPVTKPATDAAIIWQGWGTALKPACEPIVLARKPLIGTVVANVLKHGVGALNIDGCRVATDGEQPKGSGDRRGGDIYAQDEWTRTKMTNGGNVTPSLGRWPANVIHDGSEEVVGAFPDAPGQQRAVGPYGPRDQFEPRDDSGTAARFFYQVEKDTLCDLCSLPFGHASAKVFPCNVSNAELNLPTGNTPTGASVLSNVAESPAPESVGKSHRSNGRASSVGNHSLQCHPQKASTAREGVLTLDELKIVQNVKSAASLCNLCATTIAHALAEVRQSGNAAPVHFNPSIGLFKETILSHCLASYVENRESTDTILTTTNLRELFGCVFHAIAESTNSERVGSAANIKSASKRLFYSSKADSDDRLGSKHPTVKPLDLMQYMVRLVTPPKGLVLDLFAGTGTTGEAAWREGFSAVLIEREAEYQADIRRRMALCLSGPDERARASIKAKMAGKPDDHGPLFGGVA
jgi:hypothetical protein